MLHSVLLVQRYANKQKIAPENVPRKRRKKRTEMCVAQSGIKTEGTEVVEAVEKRRTRKMRREKGGKIKINFKRMGTRGARGGEFSRRSLSSRSGKMEDFGTEAKRAGSKRVC